MNMLPPHLIDFHVHLFPDKLFDAIWHYFDSVYNWKVLHHLYYRECVAYLNTCNVSHIVYSNYAHRKDIADELNRWNKQTLDEIPNLYCFAAFHPEDDQALAIAKAAIAHPKVLGFKLQLLVQNFYPQDERLFPLYELMIEHQKRILFHVGTGPVGNPYVGFDNFVKTMKRYPQLHANVAHMGGYEYSKFMDLLPEYKNLYLDTSFTFFKSMESGFDLDPALLEQNQDKLLYGSDFPNLIVPREEEIERLQEYGFAKEFYEKLFFTNGKRLIEQHTGRPAELHPMDS
jgi:hypothetical protein